VLANHALSHKTDFRRGKRVGTLRPVRAVELLLPAGALLVAVAAIAVALHRRRTPRGLPREIERLLEAVPGSLGDAVLVLGGAGSGPVVELSAAIAAPAEVGAVARALLAPHGAIVEEDAAAGHGWRLRIALPPAPAAQAAGSDAAFV
jgi:hypothetical protein